MALEELGSSDPGALLYVWRGCVFRVPDGVQPPKAGSRLFCRELRVQHGERVLEIGSGLGLAAVVAARLGAHVVATDVIPAAVEATRTNAALNGVTIDARLGDCYAPVAGERFDLICANPPQMPMPPSAPRSDAAAAADNGGPDGWQILDRVIEGAPAHLVSDGRLVFTLFGFLGRKRAFETLERLGFTPAILASEVQPFPRIGYERLEHIRSVDHEHTLADAGVPATVERLVIAGRLSRVRERTARRSPRP